MLDTIPADIQAWTEKHVGKIQSSQQLKGGISTSIFRLETEKGDFVLRVIDNPEWLAEESDLAEHEAAALKAVANANIPSPELIAFDNGESCSIPVVLSTCLPGKVVVQPKNIDTWLQELAQTLANIHKINVPNFPWKHSSWFDVDALRNPPEWIQHPHLWRQAIEICQQPLPDAPIRLLHRDYHPANVLFEDGKITAIVDWINACRGAVNIDVAICRVDVMLLHGVDAANQFMRDYETATGIKHHSVWDIHAFFDFFDSDENPKDVLQSWHDLGRTDLTMSLIHQRANDYLVDIMQRI